VKRMCTMMSRNQYIPLTKNENFNVPNNFHWKNKILEKMHMQKKYASQRICMPKRMHVLMSMKQKNRKQCKLQ
jgi:hypothetical protein